MYEFIEKCKLLFIENTIHWKPGVETLKTYQVIVRTNGIVKVIQQVNEK